MKTKQFSLFILFAATALTNAFAQNAPTSELTTGSISGGEFNVVTVDRPVPKASAATAALSNTYVPNTVTIDANKAVGEIPFTSGIAQNGAMTYNVPIEVYPGIKGMQPQLAIAYNHLSGNGLLGVGWSLSGLSSISRTVKSIYYDGASNGVSLSKDDAFVLDGMRLIKTGESTSQITYESEQGYIKATAFLNGNIVKYFEVYYPSGRKGIYGYTGNTVNKLQYPLTSLTDLYGNAVTYTYTEANNRYLPTKIAYSGASVEFAYEGRSETPIAYNAGLKIKEDKRLKYINCKLGGATLRTYSLTYIIQKNSSALSQVDLAASGKSLNPLKFWYGENNNAYKFTKGTTQLISWYNFSDKNALYTKIGKFDPDNGIEDNDDGVITFPVKNSYYRHHRDSHWYQHSQDRYDNYYDGTESIFFHTGLTSTFAGPMPSTQTEKNFIDVICANLDGVYGDEVIKINNGVSGNYDQVIFKAYQSNIYNGLALKYTRTFNFSTVLTDNDGGKSIHPKFYFPGDFNGDGKTEILAVSCNNPLERTDVTSQCYIFDLEANKVYSLGYIFPYKVFGNDAENMDKLYVMDYDGDGKSDICLVNSSGIQTYKFTGSGSTYSLNLVSTYTGMTKNSLLSGGAIFRTLLLGEFNGDGKPDLLLAPLLETDNTCYIYYGMGNGQYEKTSCQSANGAADVSFLLQDVNGDGLTDLIKGLNDRFYIYLAANGVLSSAYDGNTYTGMTKQSIIIPVNINNGEYFTRLLTLKDGIMTRYSYPRSDTKEKLLTGVASSLGVVIKNYYQSLYSNYYNPGNFESVYIKGSGAVFPYENGISFMFFPSATAQYFNGKINENRHYIYQNAVVHKQGLGFRGFERIISYDEIRDRSATQTFDPYNFGILKADESVFAKNTYVYSVSVASNKIAKIRMTSLTSQDKVKGTTATTTFSYDAYGNPTTQKVNYGDGITETLSTTYYNNTALTGYLLGFPTDRTKTVSRNGSSYKEREYIAAHDNKGSPLNKTRYYNSYQTAYEEYTYDAKGNCTQVVHKDYSSPASQTTKYTFDSYGRVTSEINPLNLKTSYQYNGTGLVSKITNCYNKARTYTYDEFGRNTQTTNFDGTIASTAYTWDKAGTNGLFRIMSSATEQPTQKTYYDALGRETRKSVTLFDGRESHIDKIYYTVGLLQKVSRSFYNYGSYWDEYSYDDYDQVSSVKEPTGRMTRYSYDGKNITVVKDGVSSTQYYDAQGNLISVSDPAGTITYNLRPDGQPTSIVAPDNVTTSFTYDSYGRQLKIIDPSAGTRTYTYDAAGNIASEKNANGKTITYAYDAYNRLTTKTSPEFTTTYVYDAYGRQTSESSTNGCSVAYTYDAYGRVATVNETVTDGKFLKRTFTYQNGKIASVKYDTNGGNITTENYSYQNGYPLEIKAGTTSFWRMYEVNVYGQPRYVVTGNFTRSYAYDVYGTPTSRTAGSFQNFSYSFDATKGNLTYRKDNKKNIQENFTYDNLNRLTGFAGKSTAYDVKGNITAMSDAGTFSYSVSGKPYAVSNIQSATALVPQRNQTVTYTSFQRPATITENGYSATFTYNGSNERVKMELKKDGQKELTKYYISQNIEIDDRNVGG
ncbi:MAG: FG-GAP-like repeat-containing protein, partial [Dysgonamonadaceae bacterium]|nr:FG-GAP-like repeat-containing protein [Dysgonamonadaceae bacterium]